MGKRRFLRVLVVLLLIAIGLGIMCYPFIANYLFENRNDSVIQTYNDKVISSVNEDERSAELEKARAYNDRIYRGHVQLHDPFNEELIGNSEEEYMELLRVDGTDVMGFIRIPCIDVELPIYHGTSAEVLEAGVGHMEGTSLPIGGVNTHSVLTGHTGLSSAKLFTDLIQMEEGDLFFLRVFGEDLAYEVDQILVVEPTDQDDLYVVDGKDYCTLLTCTPYGVNSHRLLVRGVRIPYVEEYNEDSNFIRKESESTWMWEYQRALVLSISLLVVIVILYLIISKLRDRKRSTEKSNGGDAV